MWQPYIESAITLDTLILMSQEFPVFVDQHITVKNEVCVYSHLKVF